MCVDGLLSADKVKFVLRRSDTIDAYRGVLEERLPHDCGEPLRGVTGCVGRHDGVIDESREVRTHGGQVTAVRQP